MASDSKEELTGALYQARPHLIEKKNGFNICPSVPPHTQHAVRQKLPGYDANDEEFEFVNGRMRKKKQQTLVAAFDNAGKDIVDMVVTRCFFSCSLSSNVVKNTYFNEMCSAKLW